jgi:GT2 family glycosyltransferase
MGSTSAIVIHYNGEQYIDRCLAALTKQPEITQIIFVDDGSAKNPEALVAAHGVEFVRHERNRGPIAARNTGAKHAKGDYLLFADVDSELRPGYARAIAAVFDDDPGIGAATGMLMEDGLRTWYNFGYDPHPVRDRLHHPANRLVMAVWNLDIPGHAKYLDPQKKPLGSWASPLRKLAVRLAEPFTLNFVADKQRKVDWTGERALMTRRSLFEQIGGWDEEYFMFFEGPDYCRRVRQAGFRVCYVPEAVCDHQGGHSHSSEKRDDLFAAARARYLEKFKE